MNPETLAPKIARRDEKAFGELYEGMRRLVFSVCLGIVKDRGVAEELTQDTFVTVWERTEDFHGGNYKFWILAIAKNKSLNALRRRKREISADFSENESLGGSYTIDAKAETGAALGAALEILFERERQIVLLRNSGMKVKEIAQFLQMPRGTVSWEYLEAIGRLKKYLEEGES